jgi:hypothetical protein
MSDTIVELARPLIDEIFADDERLVMSVHVYREGGELRIIAASAW